MWLDGVIFIYAVWNMLDFKICGWVIFISLEKWVTISLLHPYLSLLLPEVQLTYVEIFLLIHIVPLSLFCIFILGIYQFLLDTGFSVLQLSKSFSQLCLSLIPLVLNLFVFVWRLSRVFAAASGCSLVSVHRLLIAVFYCRAWALGTQASVVLSWKQ